MTAILTDDADRMPYGCDGFDADPYSDYDPMYSGPDDYSFRESMADGMPYGFGFEPNAVLLTCRRRVRSLVLAGALPEANGRQIIRDCVRHDAPTYSPVRERAAEIFWNHLVDQLPAGGPPRVKPVLYGDSDYDPAAVWFDQHITPLVEEFRRWASRVGGLARSPREVVAEYRFF